MKTSSTEVKHNSKYDTAVPYNFLTPWTYFRTQSGTNVIWNVATLQICSGRCLQTWNGYSRIYRLVHGFLSTMFHIINKVLQDKMIWMTFYNPICPYPSTTFNIRLTRYKCKLLIYGHYQRSERRKVPIGAVFLCHNIWLTMRNSYRLTTYGIWRLHGYDEPYI